MPCPTTRVVAVLVGLVATVLSSARSGAASGVDPRSRATVHRVLAVPAGYPTIQRAVDAARPGDLVLIAAGTYHESVAIRTPRVVVRGVDRNRVVLDGRDVLDNGVLAAADGVAVENLTVKRYLSNGLLFTKALNDAPDGAGATQPVLDGYRASYVTAYNNGLYGVYAFFARNGRFEHSYASGHADSGIYIGQCKPCNAVVSEVIAERNSIGFEGTNASGNVFVVSSVWRRNRVGVTINSQELERLAPQGDSVIAGNLVVDNNEPLSPSTAEGAFGVGIAIGGGVSNLAVRNRVSGNRSVGIAVTDLAGFPPLRNRVSANVVGRNGVDLAYYAESGGPVGAAGNCFAENQGGGEGRGGVVTSFPPDIETRLPCAAPATSGPARSPGSATSRPAPGGPVARGRPPFVAPPPGLDYRRVAAPSAQPTMPGAATLPPTPAVGLVPRIALDKVTVPPT